MKHAILIMAHKNVGHLCRLVEYFGQDCDVFLHIDRKQDIAPDGLRRLGGYKQVKLISRAYDVNWGGTSILDCEMFLLRTALAQSDACYFHLISGQDYPLRPLSLFFEYFEQHAGKEFIQYVHLPHPKWEGNTFRRLQYYYPYDYAQGKENPKKWVRNEVRLQHAKGLKRPIPDEFDHLYGNSQWFSITRQATEKLLEYTDRSPSLYRRMWMTFAPEECYISTVLVNLMGVERINPWNCRFIRWKYENGNSPANLGNEHFYLLLEREYLFARKMEWPCSAELLDRIDKYLLHDGEVSLTGTGGWVYDGVQRYEYEKAFCDFVTQLWWDTGIKTAVDMGCGAGYYVAQWRVRGLPFAGYDANPHTPFLSRMFLPEGDEACGVADLTEELSVPEPFDLVVCKDVFPYIPDECEASAIRNLVRLSSRFILLSWSVTPSVPPRRNIDEDALLEAFADEGFTIEPYMTARLHVVLKRKDCCLLIRVGKSILL